VKKIAMWAAPFAEFDVRQGVQVLDVGETYDLVLGLPGHPVLHCVVLSLSDGAVEVKFDGYVRGLATWHIVPAGRSVIVHCRIKYRLADRRWLPFWALAGRWGSALVLEWVLRRLKARVEDAVGASRFGLPLLVSPYAVVGAAALVGACLGAITMCVARWFRPQVDTDG
jgi:hypothetical protein